MLRTSLLIASLVPSALALADGHAVALKIGALGAGAEYTYAVSDRLGVRAAIYGSQIGADAEGAGIDYEADVIWDSIAVGLDFHPGGSPFRLSLGVLKNDNRVQAIARPSGTVEIGNGTYAQSGVGTLTARFGFDDTATYAGLGWDWSRNRERFGVSLDIGLVDQGDPVVRMTATGALAADPGFRADLAAEEAELSLEEGADLDVVPFGSLGFVFRF